MQLNVLPRHGQIIYLLLNHQLLFANLFNSLHTLRIISFDLANCTCATFRRTKMKKRIILNNPLPRFVRHPILIAICVLLRSIFWYQIRTSLHHQNQQVSGFQTNYAESLRLLALSVDDLIEIIINLTFVKSKTQEDSRDQINSQFFDRSNLQDLPNYGSQNYTKYFPQQSPESPLYWGKRFVKETKMGHCGSMVAQFRILLITHI
eukprot:TRINITY_DN71677_c0_g1_i1.p2 TRINITY_DN71677_c0_g1~~TRINITY_DN71677_c0_g1_i1.p2  ORF type:complete len:206 (-),score=-0.17 TRINITY_DN71677_c0_g1_i1:71-688(-)